MRIKTAGPGRVLVVSQEPVVLAEIKKMLKESFEVRIAATAKAARTALEAGDADAVVLYIGPNREDAFNAFREISQQTKALGIPVLFLAERDSESDEAAAFELGAWDYCLKRTHGTALISRLCLCMQSGANAAPDTEKTVLIAEDVAINRDIISAMLGDIEGVTLDFACDGQEAFEKVKSAPERYAIIFMDIHMPILDGIAATKQIRGLGSLAAKKIPIIALSASGSKDDTVRLCTEAGMNGHLEKPMEREQFLEACARYIR